MSRIRIRRRKRKHSLFAINKRIAEKNLRRALAVIEAMRAENDRCTSEVKTQFRALYAASILKAARRSRRAQRFDEAGVL